MKLQDALNHSDSGVAEVWCGDKMIVVGECDEEEGGYDISYKVGDMPPYWTNHAKTIDDVEKILKSSPIMMPGDELCWDPREGE